MEPKAKQNPESVVKEIKGNTRQKFNSEEKIRDNTGRSARGRQYSQHLSKRRHSSGYLLQMEQGISGGGETAA